MTEQCVCSHPFSTHRLTRKIGDRGECWAVDDGGGWCDCRKFKAAPSAPRPQGAADAQPRDGE